MLSFIMTLVHISMVLGGISAVVALLSGKRPRMSSQEKKMAVVVVLGTLIFLAMLIAVVFEFS